jgi:5-methyltetrahydrofolate--homocysteine methyltransferase
MIDFAASLQTSGDPVYVYDGAKGTFLNPLLDNPSIPTDWLNIIKPDKVEAAIKAYVDAGSQMVQTNTFCANTARLGQSGLATRTYDINLFGAQIAIRATNGLVYVAGDIGPTGVFHVDQGGDFTTKQFIEAYEPQVQGLIDGGVHLIHIETMMSLIELQIVIETVRAINPSIPIIATMTFSRNPRGEFRTLMGVQPSQLITLSDQYGILARGANCGMGPEGADILVEQLRGNNPNAILVMKLNAGLPIIIKEKTVYPATPSEMATHALLMKELGVRIIGTCCGSSPAYIEAIANALAKR